MLSALTCSEALPRHQKTAVSSLSTRVPSGLEGKEDKGGVSIRQNYFLNAQFETLQDR